MAFTLPAKFLGGYFQLTIGRSRAIFSKVRLLTIPMFGGLRIFFGIKFSMFYREELLKGKWIPPLPESVARDVLVRTFRFQFTFRPVANSVKTGIGSNGVAAVIKAEKHHSHPVRFLH